MDEIFKKRSKLNKVGDVIQFIATINLFVYWSFVPIFILGFFAFVIPELQQILFFVVGWLLFSISGIILGAFLQEYKKGVE